MTVKGRFRDSRNKWVYPDDINTDKLDLNDPLVREGIQGLTQDGDEHWNRQVGRHQAALNVHDNLDALIDKEIEDIQIGSLLDKAWRETEADDQLNASIAALERQQGGVLPVKAEHLLDPSSKMMTSEMQRNRDLIMHGRLPDSPYPDRFAGASLIDDYRGELGIDGPYRDASEVRGTTSVGAGIDPIFADDLVNEYKGKNKNALKNVKRDGVRTEYLTPEDTEELYKLWAKSVEQENADRAAVAQSRGWDNWLNADINKTQFENFASEYYGQQALKVAGMRPVADSQRYRYGQGSKTVGTDRLLEMSRGLTDSELELAADLRYLDKQGNVRVADHQHGSRVGIEFPTMEELEGTGASHRDNTPEGLVAKEPNQSININVLKGDTFGNDRQRFAGDLIAAARRRASVGASTNLDDLMKDIEAQQGIRPKRGKPYPNDVNKYRAGKLLSSGKVSGRQNGLHQYRIDDLLYGIGDNWTQGTAYRMIPDNYLLVDTEKAREEVGRQMATGESKGLYWPYGGNKATISPTIKSLKDAGAAKDLLSPASQSQFSEPYNLGSRGYASAW